MKILSDLKATVIYRPRNNSQGFRDPEAGVGSWGFSLLGVRILGFRAFWGVGALEVKILGFLVLRGFDFWI